MKLQDWLDGNSETQKAFSARSGVPQSRVNAICAGEGCSARTAYRIMFFAPRTRWTAAVELLDLVGDKSRPELAALEKKKR